MKNIALAVVAIACGCDARARPVVVGERPAECYPQVPTEGEHIGTGPGPIGWILVGFPTQQPDCTGPLLQQYGVVSSLTWRDRGNVRTDPVVVRVTSRAALSGTTCLFHITAELLSGPAGRPGTIEPRQVAMISDAWASLQTIDVMLHALTIDGNRRDLAWPSEWGESVNSIAGSHDAAPVESDALGLVIVADVSVPLADLRLLTAVAGPQLALGMRIDGR